MRTAYAALTAFALVLPAAAQESDDAATDPDEVEVSLEAALEAYRDGDLELAVEEVEYARQLMAQQKTQALAGFLPEPLDGWIKEDGEAGGMPGLGGMMASATYVGPEHTVEIQFMADNQMVASMMMMFNNTAMIGQMGELMRIGRQKVIHTNDGELQAMLDNNVLVSISGDAPLETKKAYFDRMDLAALEDF